jgi:hypothetical protein
VVDNDIWAGLVDQFADKAYASVNGHRWRPSRTSLLPGQENSEFAMPLDEFVTEVLALLRTLPSCAGIR